VTDAVVAYVPVLHEGYRRFLAAHGAGRPLFLVGPELVPDFRPLAKDVRALAAADMAPAIGALGICSSVEVLDLAGVERLAASDATLTLPAEDVSYLLVERHLPRAEVLYAPAFLRWDRTKTVQLLEPRAAAQLPEDAALAELVGRGEAAAARSVDWWRQVGAALRTADGRLLGAHNHHLPDDLSPYAVGDPRSGFFQGVHLELSTAVHAEAALVGHAAREGIPLAGATVYVTDFPCPPCAKLLAAAGVARVLFREGYAVLDGEDVLAAAGVELVRVA
jgi:dCMP deaminase